MKNMLQIQANFHRFSNFSTFIRGDFVTFKNHKCQFNFAQILSPYDQPRSVFVHSFYLVAPTLDNYRYKLFDIAHPVDLYPVDFHLDEDIQEELLSKNGKEPLSAQTEDELTNILGKILNSEKAKHVVHAILAQHPSFEPAEALSV